MGSRIEYVDSTTSTNDEAWRRATAWSEPPASSEGIACGEGIACSEPIAWSKPIARSEARTRGHVGGNDADGLVVFAEYQSAGRGRFGRTWHAPRGAGLLCSIVVIDRRNELAGGEIALLAAVAACDAIRVCTNVSPVIKWPNDLLVGGRKLGGILVESRPHGGQCRAFVVGIGINCLQQRGHLHAALAVTATSLELECAGPVDRSMLAGSLLEELDRWLRAPREWSYDVLRREWLARSEPLGQRVALEHAGNRYTGSMIDVDPAGRLVVQLDDGSVRIFGAATTTVLRQGGPHHAPASSKTQPGPT